ncbi:MAG TPA: vWA domain-containing protein [Pyrinomonadaceae bacterium]|jgi:hypothetical protein
MLKRIILYLLTVLALIVIPYNSARGQNEKKNAYGLLVDNTASLESQFAHVKELSLEVVKRIEGRGPVSLFSFITMPYRVRGAPWPPGSELESRASTKVTTGVDRSEDRDELADYINGLTVVKGQTQLFDAIRSMADELNSNVDSDEDSYKDKIIILITDGDQNTQMDDQFVSYPDERNVRKKQIEQLIKEVKQSGIKVYAVGLLGGLDAYGGFSEMTQKERAESFLKKITKETGGKAVISMSGKVNINKAMNELFAK